MSEQSVSMEPGVYAEKDANWHKQGWTAIPNALIRHPGLSADAKWAFCWLSSHTETFQITAEGLAAAGPKGRNHARTAIRELEEHGWLTRKKVRNDRTGRYDVTKYYIHPIPVDAAERTFVPSKAKSRKFPSKPAESGPDATPDVESEGPETDQQGAGLSCGSSEYTEAESALFDLQEPSENAWSDPATDRQVSGRSGPGQSVTDGSVAPYKEEVTTGEHQLATHRELPARPPAAAGTPDPTDHPPSRRAAALADARLPSIQLAPDFAGGPVTYRSSNATHHPRATRATARGGHA